MEVAVITVVSEEPIGVSGGICTVTVTDVDAPCSNCVVVIGLTLVVQVSPPCARLNEVALPVWFNRPRL